MLEQQIHAMACHRGPVVPGAESLVAAYWRKHHGDNLILPSDQFHVGVLYDFAVFALKRLEI